MDALKNEIELSEQIKKLAEHLTFIEKKLDQLLEARDRQPAHNADARPFQRPGGFRPQGAGYRPNNSGFRPAGAGYRPNNAGSGYRPSGGPNGRPGGAPTGSGYRPARPGYGQGQGGGRPYEGNRGEGRPSQGSQGGERPSGGKQPFHAKFSSKNQNRNR